MRRAEEIRKYGYWLDEQDKYSLYECCHEPPPWYEDFSGDLYLIRSHEDRLQLISVKDNDLASIVLSDLNLCEPQETLDTDLASLEIYSLRKRRTD